MTPDKYSYEQRSRMPQTLKRMWNDDEAVSAVIGVVLMLAVTILLAAVIGGFVFGVGQNLNQPTPNTNIAFDYTASSGDIEIEHAGGKKLMTSNTGELRIAGDMVRGANGSEWNSAYFTSRSSDSATLNGTIEISDTIWTTENGTATTDPNDEIRLAWVSPDGSQSEVIGTFTVP